MLAGLLAPDLSPAYLLALTGPVAESVALTLGAMTLAALGALSLACWIAIGLPGARSLNAALSLVRAVPDLTLAILAVILLGIGTGAALTALALYYAAAMAKVFADLMKAAPRPPLEALAAGGATRRQLALWGLIPLTGRDLLAYGGFATGPVSARR
jgi:phosphonate transport system permease protein